MILPVIVSGRIDGFYVDYRLSPRYTRTNEGRCSLCDQPVFAFLWVYVADIGPGPWPKRPHAEIVGASFRESLSKRWDTVRCGKLIRDGLLVSINRREGLDVFISPLQLRKRVC